MEKISKGKARSLFNNGYKIYLLSCNIRPNNPWISPSIIQDKDFDDVDKNFLGHSFDTLIRAFEHYNCTQETGRYTHFYIEG